MKKYIILIILSLGCWVGIHAQTPQKMSYVYDALNRLTQVTYPNGSKITYTYDVLGNRTSVVTVGGCTLPTATLTGTQTITAGQTANLSVALTGVGPWVIVVDGVTYNPTTTPYTIPVTPAATKTYTITGASNSCGAGTFSGSAVVTVNPACTLPTATLSGTQTITAGQSANLSVALTATGPWSIIVDGVTYSNITTTPKTILVTPSTTKTYNITNVSNGCGAGTVSGSATVTVNPCLVMQTTKSGNWNDPTVWSCNRVPTVTDNVTIIIGHNINVPSGVFPVKNITLNGTINYSAGGELKLNN